MNIHSGKRCFILGNGPSLKDQDISLLSNEYVFTVNQISRNENFKNIKSNYHFWADPNFFNINGEKEEDIELLNVMKSINTYDNIPECFFPINNIDFVKKNNLDKELNINYFFSSLDFYDNYDKNINYSSNTPAFGTVVQWAITMAIYMGFKEIYLLGCDNTGILCNINSILNLKNTHNYSYAVTENEEKRMKKIYTNNSLESYCISYLQTLRGYRYLYNYCSRRDIKLINCSKQTVIESIPREKYEDILKKLQIIS